MKIFRIDDIGASSKQFEQYSKTKWANFWFLKKIPPFKAWGPYDELTVDEWQDFLKIFKEHRIKPLIAITASWVERDSSLTPFPEKFPAEAEILKTASRDGLIDIANHGLTHCIVGQHLPLFRHSNRKQHREFWPDLPQEVHTEHVLRSQKILEKFFERPVTILVPPGNVWSAKTYQALKQTNIKQILCNRYMLDSSEPMSGVEFVNDQQGYFCFHDRELKLYGKEWLVNKILPANGK